MRLTTIGCIYPQFIFLIFQELIFMLFQKLIYILFGLNRKCEDYYKVNLLDE